MEPRDWVDRILSNAIDSRASDVHFEPGRDRFNVRFRIDGILYAIESLPRDSQENIISRTKVLSQTDITEQRLPQDGHFEFKHKDKIYNIRVSTFRTSYGEAAVLRILNREDILIRFEELGFDQDQLEEVSKLINRPYGMTLITGPSGSGKTTLLYSILNNLNKKGNNIVTLEDPIEFQMSDVRQMQINESIGLNFSRGVRATLRQDPDIIMIGEIRDSETAQMAIRAALGGILVFSTFHTLDVPALVTRFIEMGIPRSVVAQTISGVISSRLVRKVCGSCKEPYQLTAYEKKVLGVQDQTHNFQKGKGCDKCRGSGYLGRTGVFEVVCFDDEVRTYIIEQKPFSELKELFQKKRIKTLREVAVAKASRGITTPGEVIRVIGTS